MTRYQRINDASTLALKKIGHTADFFSVPTQDNPLPHRSNIEYSHCLAPRCTSEHVPMWGPFKRLYPSADVEGASCQSIYPVSHQAE